MGSNSSILDIIARGGPAYTVPQNQLTQNQADLTAAQVPETQARAALTQAQIPLTQAQTGVAQSQQTQEDIKTQLQQQQLKDMKAEMAAWAQLYGQQQPAPTSAATPPTFAPGTGAPASSPNAAPTVSGTAAAPYTIQGGLINRTGAPVNGTPSLPASGPPVSPAGA